ncbi:MAG: NlpC/P60 family protein [Candidatus Eisenbacteria bacterium]
MKKETRRLLVSTAVANVRTRPSHTSELYTQALMGTELEVIRTSPDRKWHLAVLPDGSRGWVRSWYVIRAFRPQLERWRLTLSHRVKTRCATVYVGPSRRSQTTCEVSLGVRFAVSRRDRGWVEVRLPDSGSGWVRSSALESLQGSPPAPESLVRTALRFVGAPYLWGGVTPWGCDCSGLVQSVFSFHGIRLPRDSAEQFRYVRDCLVRGGPQASRPGDLIFFGRSGRTVSHVAISTGWPGFLHAYGCVRTGSFARGKEGYLPELTRLARGVARLVPETKKDVDKNRVLQ